MSKVEEVIELAVSLSMEERSLVVETLVETLHAPDPQIETAWAEVVRHRCEELRTGTARRIPGEEVMENLRNELRRG
jgi:hypothetical protein